MNNLPSEIQGGKNDKSKKQYSKCLDFDRTTF